MFSTFKILVIYLIIPSSCANILPPNGGKSTLNSQEQVKKEVLFFNEVLQFLEHPPTEIPVIDFLKHGIELKSKLEMLAGRAIRSDRRVEHLIEEKGGLETEKKSANENILLNVWRLLIDDYEESFPQPYEDDFEEKKVKYDKSKLKNLIEYDLIEERRRQKWLFYCNNPPNKKMADLVTTLKNEKVDFDTFSRGIAKAYRLLSDKFHSGFYKTIEGDPKKYFMFKNVVIAMRMLLKQEDILDELIEQTVPKVSGQN